MSLEKIFRLPRVTQFIMCVSWEIFLNRPGSVILLTGTSCMFKSRGVNIVP